MGGDASKADSYFSQMLNNIVSEIRILNDLSEKGVQHIVRYYENDIVVANTPRRYDIFILMEYLTPLEDCIHSQDFLVQMCIRDRLIVNQGQEALFFKGGEALDLFGPGTHTLSTGNLPILDKLVNLPFGGKTPFSAEVYYINKTANLDMKWGTSTPIPLEDPKYGLILNVGARGQYGITIKDSRLFVSKIIGAVPNGTTTNPLLVLKYFNGLINSCLLYTSRCV